MISLFMLVSHASGVAAQFAAAPAAEFAVAPEPDLLAVSSSPDLAAVSPERRLESRYVKPVQNMQWPYKSSIGFGDGFNVKTETYRDTAFEDYTGEIKTEPLSLGTPLEHYVVKSLSEYHTAMEATASVEGKTWTIQAQASASIDRSESMTSKDVLFLLHTHTKGGFKGWYNNKTPPFKARAKEALCKNGTFSPLEFERAYGTHYVQGYKMRASLDVSVRIKTRTTSTDTKVSAALEGSWNGVGNSVNATASFEAQLNETHSSSSVEYKAYAFGTTLNWVPTFNLGQLHKFLKDYEENSAGGSPVALELKRFNEHEDYMEIKDRCGSGSHPEPLVDYWKNELVKVVVEAKLLWDEVFEASAGGGICERALEADAWEFYNELYETQPPVSRDDYFAARDRMDEIEAMWEECLIEAQPFLGGPNRPNASNLQACWGECDSDDDCAAGLKCFQRDGYFPIPGCRGLGQWNWDYCYDPSGSLELDSSIKYDHPTGIPACHGDCDEDHQCADGLVCFQRVDKQTPETVPGCTGKGEPGFDYCYNPNWGVPGPPMPIVETLGANPSGLDVCQGDCDSDLDCRGHLKCFFRGDQGERGDWGYIPGCRGRGKKGWDYCYDPTGSIELSGGISPNPWGLQACEGDCNHDDQCAGELLCFQRRNGETIPGCTGSGGAANWDYCYDPNWQPNLPEESVGFDCQSGQGESRQTYRMTNDNSLADCESTCSRDDQCRGFDVTLRPSGNACRLYRNIDRPRLGQPGAHDRTWCSLRNTRRRRLEAGFSSLPAPEPKI